MVQGSNAVSFMFGDSLEYLYLHSIIPAGKKFLSSSDQWKLQNGTSQALSKLGYILRAHFAVRWESVSLIRPLSMANRPLFSDQHLSLFRSQRSRNRESKRRQLIPDCSGNRRLNAARPTMLALCLPIWKLCRRSWGPVPCLVFQATPKPIF